MNDDTLISKCFFFETSAHQASKNLDSLIVFCIVLHTLSFIPAAIGNGIISLTTCKSPSLQKPSFVLLGCTAFADALTGFIAQPIAMASFVVKLRKQFPSACYLDAVKECLGWLLGGISLSILALLSIERYLVLHLGLPRYCAVISVRRVLVVVAMFSVSLIIMEVLRFHVLSNKSYVVIHLPFMFLGLLTLPLSYLRIHRHIRRRTLIIEPKPSQQLQEMNSFDIKKYERVTSAVLFIVCFYWLFFAPFVCVLVAYLILGFTERIEGAYYITTTIVLTSAAVNPILYCWKLRALRRAVVKNVKKLFYLSSD